MNCTVIENSTGEIITENFNIDTIEDVVRKKQRAEKAKIDKEFKSLQDEVLGNFVFFIFRNIYNLEEILGAEGLVKFIYMGTYVKNDMYLKLDNNLTYISKKKLQKLIKIKHSTKFNAFYNTLVENNLTIEDAKGIMINPSYFYRGYERDYKKITGNKLEEFTRIYTDTTRKLFENTESRKHKQLAIIYKLLPYISYKYNVICQNVNEINSMELKPLVVSDVMKILGYDSSNITRFKKDFYGLEYEGKQIFMTIQKTPKYTESIILVNPKVYYRGKDVEELQFLITLFKL